MPPARTSRRSGPGREDHGHSRRQALTGHSPERSSVTWEVHRRALPIAPDGSGRQLHIMLCVDHDSGLILAVDTVSADVPLQAVARFVFQAMPGAVPDRIAVVRRDLAEVLRRALDAAGMERVEVSLAQSLPALEKALRAIGERMGFDPDAAARYWQALRRSYPDMEGLMADAAAYFRAAPWSHIPDSKILQGQLKGLDGKSRTRYLTVLGAAGATLGLAAFTTRGGARSAVSRGQQALRRVSMLYVVFDDLPEADEPLKEQLTSRYDIPHPRAFPLFVHQMAGGRQALAIPDDLDELRVWLQAVPRFVDKHSSRLSHPRGKHKPAVLADPRPDIRERLDVHVRGNSFSVELAYSPSGTGA